MKLIIEPEAGITPVLTAIKGARKAIDVLIFRLDRKAIIDALTAAVARGVNVRALTANTNKGGEKRLRQLEMTLLDGGITVSRTADDLVRYHGKMMIVDQSVLHVLGFNFTALDIEKSRSFGIITRNAHLVQEALKLFEADFNRQPYTPGYDRFVVSPENARERLMAFIKAARRELLIYDPKVSDPAIVKLIVERAKAGVDVKIIGKLAGKFGVVKEEKYPGKRLHVRAIVRDRRFAFVGSQSLRKLELENRREIGVIINDEKVVKQMIDVFARDWAQTAKGRKEAKTAAKSEKKAPKSARAEAAEAP